MRLWRHRCEWLLLQIMRAIACALPERAAMTAGASVGKLIGRIWTSRRYIARANLRAAFPGWDEALTEGTVRDVFGHFGQTTFEIMRLNKHTGSRLLSTVQCSNRAVLDQAASEGKGALFLSGHIGNWELFAGWIRALGFEIDVVVKPARNALADRFYNARRSGLGVGIIHSQTGTREILQALRKGRFVAILADQYAGQEGIDVDFFGRPASTPRGPAALSLRLGCPIYTGVFLREGPGRYVADLDGRIDFQPTGDELSDQTALTQIFTTRLEQHIRRHPSQWLWTHRRWRDQSGVDSAR